MSAAGVSCKGHRQGVDDSLFLRPQMACESLELAVLNCEFGLVVNGFFLALAEVVFWTVQTTPCPVAPVQVAKRERWEER